MGDDEWELNISERERVSSMARWFVCKGEGDTMPRDLMIPPAKVARIVERFRHYLYRLHQRSAPAVAVMFELVTGAWVAQAIQVAAELGIADALAEGPLPLDDLADRVGADPDALRRLMRALISRGVFRQRRDGRYDLTALANALRSDAQFSMYAVGARSRFAATPGTLESAG